MLLIETKILLTKQELRLSKQLSLKKVTKRKVPLPFKLIMIRQLLKQLLEKKLVSKLMTIKEEELLQLPETPWDSLILKTKVSMVTCTVPDSLLLNKETKLNSTEPWTPLKSAQLSILPFNPLSDPFQKKDLKKLQFPLINHTLEPSLIHLPDNLSNNYNHKLKL